MPRPQVPACFGFTIVLATKMLLMLGFLIEREKLLSYVELLHNSKDL